MIRTRRQRAAAVALAALVVSAMVPISIAGAETEGASPATPGLFASAPEPREVYEAPDHVIRHRYVTVDTGVLFHDDGRPRNKAQVPRIAFDLFPGVTYTGEVTGVDNDRINGTTAWAGDLAGVDGGVFYVASADGVVAAHFASPEGIFEVSWAGGGAYRVIEIDQSAFVDHPEGTVLDRPGTGGEIVADGFYGPTADSGGTIDVMVLYTTEARQGEGGSSAMKARVALAMTETNNAYQRSGITTRLRLVHAEEVSYWESWDLFEDLTNLRYGYDGLDVAHARRDTFGADMVTLIIEHAGGPYCGVAWDIMASAAGAYQVTARDCMTGYYSFGHEFGHLQGARHDIYEDSTLTPYAYGHGYVNPPDRWRTVMAYNTKCADKGFFCTRLNWWSNPQKSVPWNWGGDQTGNAAAKNFRVLNQTSYTVANHRSRVISSDFGSSFTRGSKGWGEVAGTWGVNRKGWFWSRGVRDAVASAWHGGIYGDITYEAMVKRVGGCTTCANRLIVHGDRQNVGEYGTWEPSYLFQYTNNGAYSIWKITETGTEVALRDWANHPAIKPGKWNRLKVVVSGRNYKFFINNVLVWTGSDAALLTGTVGLGFYRDFDSVKNRMMVDWVKVWNTPTADLPPDERVVPGTPLEGGTANQSP